MATPTTVETTAPQKQASDALKPQKPKAKGGNA